MSHVLDLVRQPLDKGFIVEASAGTGKTYSVAALVTRLIATDDNVRIGNILITTFTRNAAAELRDRIRRRLVETANALAASEIPADDSIAVALAEGTQPEINERISRLRRAAVEFDTATIATIHSVLSKILTLAGHALTPGDDQDAAERIIEEVVNDQLLSEAANGREWDEERIRLLVKAQLSEPLTELWYDPADYDPEQVETLEAAKALIGRCVAEVQTRSTEHPSFSDLMRVAHQVVTDPANTALVSEFRERYKMAMVDESQDTDALQWHLFNALFPRVGSGALVAVGDPKQSIYKFRGADVDAYASQKAATEVVTLTTNFRTDQPLIDNLNTLFAGFVFGTNVAYEDVHATSGHAESRISGVAPYETVNFGSKNEARGLARATARRVIHLLNKAQLNERDLTAGDVVVLVRSGDVGRQVERELRRWSVPAVSAGTASVMDSEMADHIRALLEAMERVAHVGRARRLATTCFVEASITDPRILDDMYVSTIQEQVNEWAGILRTGGVASLTGHLLNNESFVRRLTNGVLGQRRLTDFSHVMELLDKHSVGTGHHPGALLQVFDELKNLEDTSEIVARRVESDLNAVQIMTIHVSKGLEFPVVVVADTWKAPRNANSKPRVTRISHNGRDQRVIDLCFATKDKAPIVEAANAEAEAEEYRRLFYVAMTRAKHHVSLVLAMDAAKDGPASISGPNGNAVGNAASLPIVQLDQMPMPSHYSSVGNAGAAISLEIAPLDAQVQQTYRRTSFTGITAEREGLLDSGSIAASGSGADESTAAVSQFPQYAALDVDLGAPMPLARIPGGTYLGKVMHKVYELLDFSAQDLRTEVSRVVDDVVVGHTLLPHKEAIAEAVVLSLTTPLGSVMDNRTLATFGRHDRLAEMDFEMGLASLTENVMVSDIGKVLLDLLPSSDILAPYARTLAGKSFEIPLAGLINGSIDALLRIKTESGPRLFITDYKTNRLDMQGDNPVVNAYSPARLVHAMEHHHYPLQSLIYGTAVHRMLRWRAPHIDADSAVAGVTYFFVRGMVGPATPIDESGQPFGVFSWTPPSGLWSALSDVLAGGRR